VWAKRRALYSNVLGYFGGITWALLVAHVCQLYPTLRSPTQMIQRFFLLYARWRFDPATPVMLTPPYSTRLGLEVWQPQRRHLAPVLTPSYPCINSTHNVSATTRRIIRTELRRAADLFASATPEWPGLTAAAPIDFFFLYKHYIDIVVTSESPTTQLAWIGYVESKLRHLFRNWHYVESIIAHPFTHCFREPTEGATTGSVVDHFYIGIQVDPHAVEAAAERQQWQRQRRQQHQRQLRQGREKDAEEEEEEEEEEEDEPKPPKIDLGRDGQELVDLVYAHMPEDKLHPSMRVNLVHLHAYQLPAWVFADARRPTHTYQHGIKKRKRAKEEEGEAEACNDDLQRPVHQRRKSGTSPASPPSPTLSSSSSSTLSPEQFIQAMAAPVYVPFPLPPPVLPPPTTGTYEERRKVSQSDSAFVVRTRPPPLLRKPAVLHLVKL
jgi:poly(A) polymerase Pap1